MKKIVLVSVVMFICLSLPEVIHSAEEVADGSSTLRNCSLALDMAQDKYTEHVLKGAEPFPSKEQQDKAIQCFHYVIGFKDALYANDIYQAHLLHQQIYSCAN